MEETATRSESVGNKHGSLRTEQFGLTAAPALMRRANLLGTGGSAEDVIGRVLRLSGGVNQKLAVVAKLPE